MQSKSMDILKTKKKKEIISSILNAVLFPEDSWLEEYELAVAVQEEHTVNFCNIMLLQIQSVTGCCRDRADFRLWSVKVKLWRPQIFLWLFVHVVWFLSISGLTSGAGPWLYPLSGILQSFTDDRHGCISPSPATQPCTKSHMFDTFCQNAVNLSMHFHGMV